MNKTKIEYLNYCWNFYTGCKNKELGICPIPKCWAKGLFHRFGRSFEPTLHPEKLLDPIALKKPARIGVCFTGDLFGEWVNPKEEFYLPNLAPRAILNQTIMSVMEHSLITKKGHQFFFLTKAPQNYQKWGSFPDNAWVGATVCNDKMLDVAVDKLEDIQAKNKWLSFEPLMEHITLSLDYALYYGGISWVVIGGWSGGKNPPNVEWVMEIAAACIKADIPYWIKDNLRSLSSECGGILNQEFPHK
jgi:protein gp37